METMLSRDLLLQQVHSSIVSCDLCPRLRTYCRRVAQEKKRAHRYDTYWGRPVPGFGDPDARLLLVGLAPAAHGANRTGRAFTGDGSGDFLMSALHRTGFANIASSQTITDGLGIRYQDDCFLFDVTYQRSFIRDQDIEPDERFLVNFTLKYLGSYSYTTQNAGAFGALGPDSN